MRLWSTILTSEEISFHIDNPTKLISSNYSNETLNLLSGLWRFNYETPQINIPDEGCQELNLDYGASGDFDCTDINGSVYTLPGYNIEFSEFGL